MLLTSHLACAVLVTLSAVACSSAQAPDAAPSPRVASAGPADTASQASQAPPGGAPASDTGSPAVNATLLSQGYKPVEMDSRYVYCRMEAVTGTQFKRRVCLSEDDIRRIETTTRATMDSINKTRGSAACIPGANC